MILFVDDDHPRLDPWISTLATNGYVCHVEGGPIGALHYAKENPKLDGAVIDIMLPAGEYDLSESDGGLRAGIMLIQDIRKLRPELPIVVLSIRADITQEVKSLGISCIHKAFDDPDDLVQALRTLQVPTSREKRG